MSFEDHTEIVRRRYEYALGIDTKDWDLFRGVFTEEISVDFISYDGVTAGQMSALSWIEGIKPLFSGLEATQHTMSNPIVDLDGDRATLTMYMQAAHFLNNDKGGREYTIGGYYFDKLERIDGRWLINSVTLNLLWSRGNAGIMSLALENSRQNAY